MWKIVDTKKGAIILPSEIIKCYRCREPLFLHGFTAGKAAEGDRDFYFCNVMMKCPKCDWVATFGIPVSGEGYEKLSSSPLHGKLLSNDLIEIFDDEDVRLIKEKLEKWGYW